MLLLRSYSSKRPEGTSADPASKSLEVQDGASGGEVLPDAAGDQRGPKQDKDVDGRGHTVDAANARPCH